MGSTIYFVHEGKAAYPEVTAMQLFFGGDYRTDVAGLDELARKPDVTQSAAWHMMGFYPRRPAAKLVIHDYRSLSVGRFRRAKDLLKRVMNANPDIRVFQNDDIRKAMGFPKDSRTYYLPMGVPDIFVERRGLAAESVCDFIYIGSMLDERRCELMLDSFVGRFGATRSFHLYGAPNPALEARYQGRSNIRFCGLIPQAELLDVLKAARVGVAYFPNHFPHVLQTPTKLMEYAAVGLRILANEQPQNRAASQTYGVACCWGPADDMFRDVPEDLDWPDNAGLDVEAMRWSSVLRSSGLPEVIAAAIG
jgi:hypothetical protein